MLGQEPLDLALELLGLPLLQPFDVGSLELVDVPDTGLPRPCTLRLFLAVEDELDGHAAVLQVVVVFVLRLE